MIRKNPNGTYSARLGHGPQRTFPLRREAQEYLDKQSENKRRARAGLPVEKGPIRYRDLAQLYLDQLNTKSKSWRERMVKKSVDEFGDAYVRTLSGDEVGKWLNGLALSPKTKTHVLGSMRAVMNAGIEWGYLSRSPVRPRAVRAPGTTRLEPIQPFEDWAEVERVAEAAGAKHGALIRFACATGLRPGEWQDLRWRDVDIKSGQAFIRGTKTEAATRTIYLSKQALKALASLPRPLNPNAYVFAGRGGKRQNLDSWRRIAWEPALALAGMDYRPLYQMRHTFATLALTAGASIEDVSKMMGHTTPLITHQFYRKFTTRMMERTRAILDTIGEENDQESNTSTSTKSP